MTETLIGRYFFPRSARCVPARAVLNDGALRIEEQEGNFLLETPLSGLEVSPRLGNLPRRFVLPDGACFETDDNDAADLLLGKKLKGGSRIHRLEQSWRWAAAAILAAGAMVYLFVAYGIPLIALWLAEHTPPSANAIVATQTLQVLDRTFLSPSKLNAADTQKAQMLFGEVAAQGRSGPAAYRLLLRDSPRLGPNAFALPDGTIVMTDELLPMVKADDELEGVFAHEIAHVDRAHTLQALYQAALVPAAIALATGDLSQISQIATLLPGVLLQAAYSRRLEQQADDDAAIVVKRLGGDPSHLADLLERMEARLCQKSTCPPNWLGTHPESRLRALRLRSSGAAAELKH